MGKEKRNAWIGLVIFLPLMIYLLCSLLGRYSINDITGAILISCFGGAVAGSALSAFRLFINKEEKKDG